MRKITALFILFLIFTASAGYASDGKVRGRVADADGQPLVSVYVHWNDLQTAVVSNPDGTFAIDAPREPGATLCAQLIGYSTECREVDDYDREQSFVLRENIVMDEVEIVQTVAGRSKNRFDVLNREAISSRELSRAACCSLSESFETNPSVDVSYSDAVTGAKQIQLLGLAGKYVQMLTENYPNFRGVSSLYGMDYIPGPWMQSIQVSKGAASVKNGYESITGQINVEYKKPHLADPLSVNLFAGADGRYEINADGNVQVSDRLYTGLLVHYSTENESHDSNNDTFLDMPKRHQLNLMNRWHYQTENFISQSGVKYINDKRTSGQTRHTLPAGHIFDPYEIRMDANRGEVFTKNGFILDNDRSESIAVMLSGTYHDQQSRYDAVRYDVSQTNLYASLMYETDLDDSHRLSTGLSYNYDNYDQSGNLGENLLRAQPGRESTGGAYAEYTFAPTEQLSVLAGVRADYSSIHGWFATPRLHARYNPAEWVALRASAGRGYRTSFALSEHSYLIASSREMIIAPDLRQERAWNLGASASFYVPVGSKELTLSGEWYYTTFDNQIVVDLDSDAHRVLFYNLDGRSDATVVQFEASLSPFRGFTLLGAYRWMDAQTNYNGDLLEKPLQSKYKALATVSYETKLRKWQFDFTAQFNGGGRLPNPDVDNPLWDAKFKPFTLLQAQVTKNFRTWSIYAGGENLTDFKQKHPIISASDPRDGNFDATMVWGPAMGRKFYVGIRYNISK